MNEIRRIEMDEIWADSTIIEAGDYIFTSYCMRNEGESVVQMDCLFKDIMDIHKLPPIIKERFHNKYPARKAFETKFLREGISFQIDAVAYKRLK